MCQDFDVIFFFLNIRIDQQRKHSIACYWFDSLQDSMCLIVTSLKKKEKEEKFYETNLCAAGEINCRVEFSFKFNDDSKGLIKCS